MDQVFKDCENLSSLVGFEKTQLTVLGNQALYNTSITELHFPKTITSIDASYFNFSGITVKRLIFEKYGSITNGEFKNLKSLEYIEFKEFNVNSIIQYGGQLRDSTNLKTVILGEGLTSIGNSAFAGCSTLNSVKLPNSLTLIDSSAFASCLALTNVQFGAGLETIASLSFSESGLSELTLPNSVRTIEAGAFMNCTKLSKIVLNEGLQTINGDAFSGCTNLSYIVIPKSVTTVCNFYGSKINVFAELYKEEASTLEGWSDLLGVVGDDTQNVNLYYADEWSYVNGIPTKN